MPAATPNGFVYPLAADVIDVHGDMQALAESIDTWVTDEAATTDYVDAAVAGGVGGLITVPIGAVMMYGGVTAPTNWLLCRGEAVSRTTYSALFAVISTRFGTGDGSTTFTLPDMQGRSPIGYNALGTDPVVGTSWSVGVGEKFGSKVPSMPSHNHDVTHQHTGATAVDGNHMHDIPAREDPISGSLGSLGISNAGGDIVRRQTIHPTLGGNIGDHNHAFTTNFFVGNTGLQGAGSVEIGNYHPGQSVNFIIRAT